MGRPRRIISERFAPLPPSRADISFVPSPKKYIHFGGMDLPDCLWACFLAAAWLSCACFPRTGLAAGFRPALAWRAAFFPAGDLRAVRLDALLVDGTMDITWKCLSDTTLPADRKSVV